MTRHPSGESLVLRVLFQKGKRPRRRLVERGFAQRFAAVRVCLAFRWVLRAPLRRTPLASRLPEAVIKILKQNKHLRI